MWAMEKLTKTDMQSETCALGHQNGPINNESIAIELQE